MARWEYIGTDGFKIPIECFSTEESLFYQERGFVYMTTVTNYGQKFFHIVHPDGYIHKFDSNSAPFRPSKLRLNLDGEGMIDSYEFVDPHEGEK
jgi:hypothetical protein